MKKNYLHWHLHWYTTVKMHWWNALWKIIYAFETYFQSALNLWWTQRNFKIDQSVLFFFPCNNQNKGSKLVLTLFFHLSANTNMYWWLSRQLLLKRRWLTKFVMTTVRMAQALLDLKLSVKKSILHVYSFFSSNKYMIKVNVTFKFAFKI